MSSFDTNLDKNSANFVPLSPLSFISRVKDIYPNYESLIYGNRNSMFTCPSLCAYNNW